MILAAVAAEASAETFTTPWRRALMGGAGTIRRASATALESETPP